MIKIANIEIYHDIQLSFGTSDVKRTVIKQNSEDTHILRIKLYDNQNNEMVIDSNWSINISALKGDKTHILNTNNISVKDNTVYVTMTKQMLTASGTEHCELIIQDGEQVLFSDTFLIYVEPNVQDGSFIESSDEYDSIVDTLGYVQEKKDRVDQLTEEIEETKVDINNTYDELKIAVEETNDLIQENQIIKSNEADRQLNETIRQTQEIERETNTATAISNAEKATKSANDAATNANNATDDLQTKLDSHHFVLTEDKDIAGGVPSLDSSRQIPKSEVPIVSDLTATASELNVLDGITATTEELNYVDGVTSNIQTQLNSKSVNGHTHDDRYYTESEIDSKISDINSSISSHTGNKSNPHKITKAQVGLGNVENKSSATIRGEITNSNVTTALGYTPLNQSLKGSADGLAELDSNGKVLSSQLPSYVDDVIEGYLSGGKFYKESTHTTEISGESGKIYIDLHTGKTYRWSGSTFGVISETLALGETSSTAYRGDRGKVAYDHSQTAHAPSNAQQNVQSDWNATSGDAFIKNKPTIPTKVGELTNDKDYATKTDVTDAIDDIEIGGRNLYLGTKDFSGDWSNKPYWYVSSETYKGFTVMSRTGAWSGLGQPVEGVVGEIYTFSGYVKKTGGSIFVYANGTGDITNNGIYIWTEDNKWVHFSVTAIVSTSGSLRFRVENSSNNETTYVCGLKLEKGNKATDWTPAIEDTEAEIQAVDNKLTTNLLKPTLATTTQNGVTFTNNGDGTYTLNGTATANSDFTLFGKWASTNTLVSGGTYNVLFNDSIIDGLVLIAVFNTTALKEIATSSIVNAPNGISYVIIRVYSGTTLNNKIVKPMITTNLNATYDDFVPYTGSTGQLNSDVADIQSALDGKLSKTTYEYNKTLSLGSSGKVCIGVFPCYDSNISVEIKFTTDKTYNGTLVIATQNIGTSSGAYLATVYGDEDNTLTPLIRIQRLSDSNAFSAYINLPSYSKTILHIQCASLKGTPSSIATVVDSIPSTATIVPTNAFTHTHEIADVTGLQSALDGKLDKFTSGGIAGCSGDGKYSYFKIATIKITNAHIDRPIVFEMSGRGRGLSLVTIEFNSTESTDPTLSFFASNWDNCFWIKKTATSTWEVYGQHRGQWGDYALHRITGNGANLVDITVNMTNIDSLPSGCTQVSYGGNVNYANSAGNADTLEGNHASAFATASHTHTKSQIDDFPTSLPASDVYAWAKASSKPSYTWYEIGSKPSFVDQLTLSGSTLKSKNNIGDPHGCISELDFYTGYFYGVSATAINVTGDITVGPNGTIKIGDHYVYAEEKGTWEGILKDKNNNTVATSTGLYRKIGDMVYIQIEFINTSNKEYLGFLSGLPCAIGRICGPISGTTLVYQDTSTSPAKPVNLGSDKSTTVLISSTTSGVIYVYGWYQTV